MAVVTAKIAGISRSIASRLSGRYISTISPSPAVRLTCHFRFRLASCASCSSSGTSVGAAIGAAVARAGSSRRGVAV
jgi:hypothetical protein